MGFCTHRQCQRFLEDVLPFEHMLVGSEIQILKYYLDVSKKEQKRRLKDRHQDPLKQWKTSEADEVAVKNGTPIPDHWPPDQPAASLARAVNSLTFWMCTTAACAALLWLSSCRFSLSCSSDGVSATSL